MEDRINSFPPFIDKDSKILILGSVPSKIPGDAAILCTSAKSFLEDYVSSAG